MPRMPRIVHAGAEADEVLVEEVLNLLASQILGAAGHQLGKEAGRLGQALQVFGVAVVQGHSQMDRLIPGFLGEERELHSADRLGPLHAGLDGQGRDVGWPRLRSP